MTAGAASWEGDHATSGRARAVAGLRQSTTSTVLAAQHAVGSELCCCRRRSSRCAVVGRAEGGSRALMGRGSASSAARLGCRTQANAARVGSQLALLRGRHACARGGSASWAPPSPAWVGACARAAAGAGSVAACFGSTFWGLHVDAHLSRATHGSRAVWDGRLGLGIHMLFRGEDGEMCYQSLWNFLRMSMCVEVWCYLGDTSVESQSDSTPVEGNSANLSAA